MEAHRIATNIAPANLAVLLVEDDPGVMRSLVRSVEQTQLPVECVCTGTIDEAWTAMQRPRAWCGFVIDVTLPDGNGLNELLPPLRWAHPLVSALVLTGREEPEIANLAYDLDAWTVYKPARDSRIRRFVREGFDRQADRLLRSDQGWARPVRGGQASLALPDAVREAVDWLAERCGFTGAERETVELLAGFWTRTDLIERLGLAPTTVYSRCRDIRDKTGLEDIGQVAILPWRLAFARAARAGDDHVGI